MQHLFALLLAAAAAGATPPEPTTDANPTIGIALSGGGARGLAHVGVLKALEELRVPIHAVAGTSIGAIAGALYASGMEPDAMAQLVESLRWEEILTEEVQWRRRPLAEKQDERRYYLGLELGLGGPDRGLAPAGVLAGQNLELLLRRLVGAIDSRRFDSLAIPFRAVATDVNAARPFVLSEGDLARALRASMAIPLLFEPVEIDNHLLVDGGILNNLPVDVVRDMGADVVIAIDVSSPLGEVGGFSSLFEVAYQSIDTALVQNTLRSLASADLVIAPELEGYTAADFDAGAAMIELGYRTTMGKRRFLEALALPETAYRAYRERVSPPVPAPPPLIEFVEYAGHERTDVRRLRALTADLVGEVADPEKLEQAVARLYGLQSFVSVGYELIRDEAGRPGVRFRVREKAWGPDYLRFGLVIASDVEVDTDFRLLIGHRRRNLNALGGEWINDIEIGNELGWHSEWYQPLDFRQRYFIAPYLESKERIQRIFEGNRQQAEFEIFSARAGLDLGFNFGLSQLRAGLWRGVEDSEVEIGEADRFRVYDDDEGAARLRWLYDSLDRPLFARRGALAEADLNLYRDSLGAEADYERLDFRGFYRIPVADGAAVHLELIAHAVDGDEPLPGSAFVTLGGLDDLAGYPAGSLIGERALAVRAGVVSGLQPFDLPVIGPPRLIALAHGGDVWNTGESPDDFRYGAAAGMAVDLLGAMLFAGTGYTDDGDVRYYLRVGTSF